MIWSVFQQFNLNKMEMPIKKRTLVLLASVGILLCYCLFYRPEGVPYIYFSFLYLYFCGTIAGNRAIISGFALIAVTKMFSIAIVNYSELFPTHSASNLHFFFFLFNLIVTTIFLLYLNSIQRLKQSRIILFCGWILAASLFGKLYKDNNKNLDDHMSILKHAIDGALKNNLRSYYLIQNSSASFISSNPLIGQAVWKNFIEYQQLKKSKSTLKKLNVIFQVPRKDWSEESPILNTNYMKAQDLSRDTGESHLTVVEDGRFLQLVTPIFYGAGELKNIRDRKLKHLGQIVGLVSSEDFFREVIGREFPELSYKVLVNHLVLATSPDFSSRQSKSEVSTKIELAGQMFLVQLRRSSMFVTYDKLASMLLATVFAMLTIFVSSLFTQLQIVKKELKDQLENELLKKSQAELLERNNYLKDFTSIVSHDLKAPLRGILGYAQELKLKHSSGLNERAHFCLTQIINAGKNLEHLIEDLLQYARMDVNTPIFSEVDLPKLVAIILAERELVIKENRTVVKVDIPFTTLTTWEIGLQVVLSNLIDNAIKFSRKASLPQISIRALELENSWQIIVSDNGIGFDMNYYERLFKLFSRLVTVQEFEGTGAGLTITKKILDKLNGSIRAESKLGEGAIFFVEIPKIKIIQEITS